MLKKTLTISLLSLLLFAGLGAGYTYFKENKANIMNLAASAASTVTFGKDIDLGTNCLIFNEGQQCEPGGGGGLGGHYVYDQCADYGILGGKCTASASCDPGEAILWWSKDFKEGYSSAASCYSALSCGSMRNRVSVSKVGGSSKSYNPGAQDSWMCVCVKLYCVAD